MLNCHREPGRRTALTQAGSKQSIHIVQVLEATVGGTRTHVLQLVRGLRTEGHRVTLVASAERNAHFRREMTQLESEGISVIELPMKRRIAPLSDVQCLLRMKAILRSLDPDIVHTHASKAGALGRLAARQCGIRHTIHTPHTFFFQGKRGIGRWFFRALERWLLRFTGRLIVLSEGQRTLVRQELCADMERVALIGNGVDIARFTKQGRREECREELGLPPDAPAIGAITRFVPQKANDVFLGAAAMVIAQNPETRFVIVGRGPLRGKLQAMARQLRAADNLIWLDHLDDPRRLYEAVDVFALSSRYEGMPYALLEAMAMELPVIATRIPGCEEVITESSGVLVPPNQPEALASAILQLVCDPQGARQMGRAGRERVAQEFSLETTLRQTVQLYDSMVSPPDL